MLSMPGRDEVPFEIIPPISLKIGSKRSPMLSGVGIPPANRSSKDKTPFVIATAIKKSAIM